MITGKNVKSIPCYCITKSTVYPYTISKLYPQHGSIQLLWITKIHSISNKGPYNFHSMAFCGFSKFFPVDLSCSQGKLVTQHIPEKSPHKRSSHYHCYDNVSIEQNKITKHLRRMVARHFLIPWSGGAFATLGPFLCPTTEENKWPIAPKPGPQDLY